MEVMPTRVTPTVEGISILEYHPLADYTAYLAHIKELTDNKLDYAYLWGDRRNDLIINILSGPATVKGYPSISMQNIQYVKNRFIILTNSASKQVRVEVSGFPTDCLNLLNMHTGKNLSLDASVSLSIEPLGVRMYKVSK